MTTSNQTPFNLIRYALIQGKKYPINTDFRVAIQCDIIINDAQIDDLDRGILITGLLFGEDSPYCQEALDKASLYLSGGETNKSSQKRLIDFVQHWDLIYSTFLGQYGRDLHKDDLSYQEFSYMLRGAHNTALTSVIDLLNLDPKEEKDMNVRRKIIEAQNKLKIKEVKVKASENDSFLSLLASDVKGG